MGKPPFERCDCCSCASLSCKLLKTVKILPQQEGDVGELQLLRSKRHIGRTTNHWTTPNTDPNSSTSSSPPELRTHCPSTPGRSSPAHRCLCERQELLSTLSSSCAVRSMWSLWWLAHCCRAWGHLVRRGPRGLCCVSRLPIFPFLFKGKLPRPFSEFLALM